MKHLFSATCALLVFGAAASSGNAAPVAYRASTVAGVRVRDVDSKTVSPKAISKSPRLQNGSIFVRPGAARPDVAALRGTKRRAGIRRALPGGGFAVRLDPSWRSASRAVVVNGKVKIICTDPGHSKKAHFHAAR